VSAAAAEAASAKKGLGRGLSALLGDAPPEAQAGGSEPPRVLAIELLHPGAAQPRTRFDDQTIAALAESIRENGVIQPLIVRPRPGDVGGYEIVAGERRWRAAQQAQLHEVPVVIRELTDERAGEIALVENVQREDLSPIEEAEGYRRLIEQFGHTQDSLAKRVGKSRVHVANSLRLLGLPGAVRTQLEDGALSAGHARALLGAADPTGAAAIVAKRGLTVRQTEALVRSAPKSSSKAKGGRPAKRIETSTKDADTIALERDLSERLGLVVSIDANGDDGGVVSISYRSLEQLDALLGRLS